MLKEREEEIVNAVFRSLSVSRYHALLLKATRYVEGVH